MARIYTVYYVSGTNTPADFGSTGSDFRYFVDYSSTTDNASNTSTITANLYIDYHKPTSIYETKTGFITIDGETKYISRYLTSVESGATWIGSFSKTIVHDATGYREYYIQGGGNGIATGNVKNILPTIPRYANIRHGINAGITYIGVSWYSDVPVDWVRYYLNDSSTWVDVSSATASNGNFTINGLSPNADYAVSVECRRKDSGLWTKTGNLYIKTYDHARIIGASDFTDENNPVISFTNPGGAVINVRLEATGLIIRRDGIANITPYTFVLTEAERNLLRAYTPNSNSAPIRFTIATKVGSSEKYWSWQDKTLSIVNGNPVFTNFTYEDTNATTIALTGSNQKIIKGYSNVKATVSTANKAVAIKYATMSKYRFVVGTKQVDANYSSSSNVTMSLSAISNNVFTVYAIDSRGNSTLKQLSPATYLNYFDPYYSTSIATRTGGVGTNSNLNFSGQFFNTSFGAVANTITATYKYKKTTSVTYINGTTTLTMTKNGNTFSFNGLIAGDLGASGFDANYSYDIQITAVDKLKTITKNIILATGKPNLAIHIDGVSVNGPYDATSGGDFQIGGVNIFELMYPIGTGFVDYTNTDYSNRFGLTWKKTCVGKTPVGLDTSQTEFNTIGKTGGAKTHSLTAAQNGLHNHTISGGNFAIADVTVPSAYGVGNSSGYALGRQSTTASNGSGAAHNNLQPYQVVNFWKRTA